jgi:hypothetical protein
MAYDFTAASSQYLTMPISGLSYAPVTIASWVNFTTPLATNNAIASIGPKTASAYSSSNRLQILTSGRIQAASIGSLGAFGASGAVVSGGTWFHGCGVFSSETSRSVYLNGGFESLSTANCGTQDTISEMQIGCRYANGTSLESYGFFTNGLIADVGIWNVALTDAEIASLAKGVTCNLIRPQSLVFYAPLIRNLQDVRGGLTITNNNGATVANHPRVYR